MIHKLRTLKHKHVKQYRTTTLTSKRQKYRFELEDSPSLPTKNIVSRGSDFQMEARFVESIHLRVNRVSGLVHGIC